MFFFISESVSKKLTSHISEQLSFIKKIIKKRHNRFGCGSMRPGVARMGAVA